MKKTQQIYVLAGPTAVGKGTVVRKLRSLYPDLYVSISATTRPPRPTEVEGRDYYFVSETEFDQMIANHELLEYAVVHQKYRYGTPRSKVMEECNKGKVVLLEIDLAGARQVKNTLPGAYFIFLAPPSWEELTRRLVGRGSESQEEQLRRLETAKTEMTATDEFDVVVINDNLDTTVKELSSLMGLD